MSCFVHFTKDGKSANVRPSGPLRVNNGDAMMPALIAGSGLGILPEFILRDTLAAGQLERLLPDWSIPPRCCLLANAARGTEAQTGRGPRGFSGRQVVPPHEARNKSGTHERAEAGQQSQVAMKFQSS
jgi:LysR substrate binding domain-containing protein